MVKYLFGIIVIICFCLFAFTVNCDDRKGMQNYNDEFSERISLKTEYNISSNIHIKKYGIQNVIAVPNIEMHKLESGQRVLTYRTEFHNGNENGCLLVFNLVDNDRIIPFFVLEELFYDSYNSYFQRVIRSFSTEHVEYDLIYRKGEERTLLRTVVMKKSANVFKVNSINEIREGVVDAVLYFSDVYQNLNKRIMNGSY